MAVTLRRKQSLTGAMLYQVWPDDHPANLLEPPWLPAHVFCDAIKGALLIALLLGDGDEVEFTQDEWDKCFDTAKGNAVSDPANYSDWGFY